MEEYMQHIPEEHKRYVAYICHIFHLPSTQSGNTTMVDQIENWCIGINDYSIDNIRKPMQIQNQATFCRHCGNYKYNEYDYLPDCILCKCHV